MQQQLGKLILAPKKPNSILEIFVAHKDLVEKSNLGQLFILIEINSREKGTKEKIKQIINLVQNDYYSSPVPNVESSLETTCQNLNLNLADIIAKPEIWFKKVNILIGVFKDDFLAMTSFGQFSGYLIRQNRITQILDSSLEDVAPGNFFAQLTTGEVKVGDVVVLSNYALFDFFSLEKIKEVTNKLKIGQVIEQFKNVLKENVKVPHVLSLISKYEAETFKVENSDEQTRKYLKDLYGSQESMQQLENLEQRTGRTLKSSMRPNLGKIVKSVRDKFRKIKSGPSFAKATHLHQAGVLLRQRQATDRRVDSMLNIEPTSKPIQEKTEIRQDVDLEKPTEVEKPSYGLKWAIVIMILVIIFTSSLIYLHFSKQHKDRIRSYENILVEVNNKKDEAQAVLIYQDDEKAGNLLNSALSLLDGLPTEDEKWQIRANVMRNEIRKLINEINNIYEVELTEAADFESLGPIKQVIRKGDFLYVLINQDKVYKISLLSKEFSELYTDLDAQKIINWSDKGFLILDNSNQIYFRHKQENDLLNIKLNSEHQIADLQAYGDRIYYLDKTMGAIYKVSQPIEANPNITVWTQQDKELLNSAKQMSVDGNIWLANGGKIIKLFKGEQKEFIISKLEDKLGVDLRIYTEQDWRYLYVLDKINGRILQIDKEGTVHGQLLNEKFKESDNLNINADESVAWVSLGNKIYEVSLSEN